MKENPPPVESVTAGLFPVELMGRKLLTKRSGNFISLGARLMNSYSGILKMYGLAVDS